MLSKLAPEQSFIIDKKHRDNDKHNCCNCGCGAEINYGDTGIVFCQFCLQLFTSGAPDLTSRCLGFTLFVPGVEEKITVIDFREVVISNKGHEEVWHGYLDIMVSSHEEVVPKTPAMTEPVAKKCKQGSNNNLSKPKMLSISKYYQTSDTVHSTSNIEENEEHSDKNDDSKDGKSNRYRKIESPDIDTEDQAIAQAIVFSLLQKSKHPDSKMFLIPTIVISREHFRILMYDAENDVLLRSQSLGLFVTRKSKELSPTCIVILWMVLHFRIFCSGLKKVGLNEDLQDLNVVKSRFREKLTPESIKLYDSYLKSNVGSFPTTERKGHDENPYI
ncbi:hypothetical protein KUTeg_013781, partial [Tegillarca granosa]